MRRALFVLAVLSLVSTLIPSGAVSAQEVKRYYFDDTGVPGWGQTWEPLNYWEPMDATLGDNCMYQDFEQDWDFYTCSDPMTADLSEKRIRARVWAANNNPGSNPITVELRRGSWGDEGTKVAEVESSITNQPPAREYIFDFGIIPSLNLSNESLIVKMIYEGAAYDGHIYWNCKDTPSALQVPTVSTWGMVLLLAVLLGGGMTVIRRRSWCGAVSH